MPRLLFVDDERKVLSALQRMLFDWSDRWDLHFASSGDEALTLLAKEPFDVVVSDMRMPGMDGAQLLSLVQRDCPGVIRIVLSGQADVDASLRAVPVAHQFLTKPCDAATLKAVLQRACQLHQLLASEPVRKVVGRIATLPARPETYDRLLECLSNPTCSAKALAEIVERDVALSGKILQTVNSAFFGRRQAVTSVFGATTMLGSKLIKDLVISAEIVRLFHPPDRLRVALADHERRGCVAASIAGRIFQGDPRHDDAFFASLVHDMGLLVLAVAVPDDLERCLVVARESGRREHAVEHELLGSCHAEVGAYLLGLWGMPDPVVGAVAYHHRPSEAQPPRFDVLAVTHVAAALAAECADPDGLSDLDHDFLGAIGVADRLPLWRDQARELTDAVAKETVSGR
jgi:HD-like signal output (HDOD) protein